jgi:hypothetical protein
MLAELDTEELRWARELRDAERRLADLRERDRIATSARRAEPHELRKSIVVALRGEGGELRVSYFVEGARWAPLYTMRMSPDASRALLELRAIVCQNTGEDWNDVALSLCAAEPTRWAELPELRAIRIGRRQPPAQKRGWRPPPSGTDALFADFDRELRDLSREEELAPPPAQPEMPKSVLFEVAAMVSAGAPPPGAMPAAEAAHAPTSYAAPLAQARPAPPPPPSAPASSLLDYGRLRIAGIDERSRGKLVAIERRHLYVELVRELRVEIDLDRALSESDQHARACFELPLPDGCSEPRDSSGYDYAYPAQGRLDVPSDGAFHTLALRSCEAEAHARYVIVPRESRDAFRFVEVQNPLDAPLLRGPVDVYLGDAFVLTSQMQQGVPPRGVLRLGLGVEERLKVARNARYSEESAGLIGGSLRLLHAIEIEISNGLAEEAEIEVRERIPVTREGGDDDIEIRELAVTPKWEEWEPTDHPSLRGGRRWCVTAPPSAKLELRAGYEVKIASKNEIVGGNRREA